MLTGECISQNMIQMWICEWWRMWMHWTAVDLDSNVDMERDSEDEEDEEKEDEKEEEVVDEDEEEDVDEDEDEDEDEDNGKGPWTISQEEMENTTAEDADTMVHDQPTVLAEQAQAMREYIPQPEPSGPWPKTTIPRSLPHHHELCRLIPSVGWRFWGL